MLIIDIEYIAHGYWLFHQTGKFTRRQVHCKGVLIIIADTKSVCDFRFGQHLIFLLPAIIHRYRYLIPDLIMASIPDDLPVIIGSNTLNEIITGLQLFQIEFSLNNIHLREWELFQTVKL